MIKFLKDHGSHKKGDECDHVNEDYLIRVGVAEKVKEIKVEKAKQKETKKREI